MTEKQAQDFAARLTRIWGCAPDRDGESFVPTWSFRSGEFRFDYPLSEQIRLEVRYHRQGCSLCLKRELIHQDEARPWYEESQITRTGSLSTNQSGKVYSGFLDESEAPELFAQFTDEWLPFFRKNCWLSGYPVECSGHEQVEWMQGFTRQEIEAWNSVPITSIRPEWDIQESIEKQFAGALEKFNMTPVEFSILSTVGYNIFLPADELARYARDLGDDNNSCETEYLQALRSCLAREWLRVVTPEMHQAEVTRLLLSSVPELCERQAQVGDITFTAQGFFAFRQTVLEALGQDHVEHNDSGWNLDEEKGQVEILAGNRNWLQKRVQELLVAPSSYLGEGREIVSVGEPEPLVQWKPNTFITLPEGFRCRIVYHPDERSKFPVL